MLPAFAKSHNSFSTMKAPQRFSNSIILPSENQNREFDGKLLLACVLAERGFNVIVGPRHQIHNHIAAFPQSIYIAKDFRKPSERILSIIEKLGHCIVAWDEEGLVQPKPEIYYNRRYTETAISHVRHVFAWGPANEKLMLGAPKWPNVPIHHTGNPRIDLLRSEVRDFHADAVTAIKSKYGRFVLFDSNFASFNPAVKTVAPVMAQQAGERSAYFENRQHLFNRWRKILPELAKAISPVRLVIRPHPAEDHALWLDVSKGISTIDVVHEGSALPWILAAEVMLHSGCTTGVEAYVMGKACISFQLDGSAKDLPDALSVAAVSELELVKQVKNVIEGEALRFSEDLEQIAEQALFALQGPLAVDRIAEILEQISQTADAFGPKQITGAVMARLRHLQKTLSAFLPDHKTSKAINALRYPGVSLQETETKIGRFSSVLNRFPNLHVHHISDQIYCVSYGHH
jgi:surface carbohydrate biosynthesis protein